jgi:uncharacterized protein (DUF1501 family)
MGEFGRTPKINENMGRDHWPNVWSVVLGGARIKGGQAIGNSGPGGEEVKDRPVKTNDLYATICAALGIDYKTENVSPEGRPIGIVDRGGKPVQELIG